MINPAPNLFDTRLISQRLARTRDAGRQPAFLERLAADELAGRLGLITRRFAKVGLVSFDADRLAGLIAPELAEGATVTRLPVLSDDGLALETTPLSEAAFDCLIVTAGLEWINDLPGALSRLQRALVPDGVMLAAMLGGDTLSELRLAWLQTEADLTGGASPRVAPFVDVRDAGGLLQRAGFALPVADTDRLTVRYDGALALMQELKSFGLANGLVDRRRTITPAHLLARVCAAYDHANRDGDGRVRATFQLLYLTGWSPHESQQKPLRPGSAKASLADALNVTEGKLPRD